MTWIDCDTYATRECIARAQSAGVPHAGWCLEAGKTKEIPHGPHDEREISRGSYCSRGERGGGERTEVRVFVLFVERENA